MMKNHKQNLHVHSVYCDGKDTPEEMIAAAMAAGFDSLGFSIHSYMSCSKSGFLSLEKQASYNVEIERLKEKYRGTFPIYRGVEFDVYADSPWQGYDYTIASVHYLHTSEGLEAKRCFERSKEKLSALLDERGRELLERIGECNNELGAYALEDAFVKGFSLGARLMAEGLTDVKS